jgi:hypothetical protein
MSAAAPTIPAKVIVTAFALTMVVAAVFAWFVVRNVRRDAEVADQAARAAAWAILVQAEQEGAFPTARLELEAAFGVPAQSTPAIAPQRWGAIAPPPASAEWSWPTTPAAAGVTDVARLPEELRTALRLLTITFAADPRDPPRIGGGGQPTRLGTLVEINGWLENWALARRVARP